ncbi:alpha/beta hydrolase-fold protein [Aquimarina gracilis]|uniref:Alpha/beta hydrolase-fold protein n=1 Tax=Aquimarina gracilis TaxID=874422 RepID=A0ABU5ZPW6_9FLAO|nr:alpha/beta hydrolase-fold protein [Aquimarina gracilis]MEB3344003.1 alpha/beta hydrolase-fold protein [Aquimarina gracilis]
MNRLYLLTALIVILFLSCKQKEEKQDLPPKSSGNIEKTKEDSKKSTAQPNVIVLDKQFKIARLNRNRQIRIYLPPNYKNVDKKYPVLYMHDAQNLFDNATSYSGEWGVDESLNEVAKKTGLELIVVGIDNGQEKRMNELSPWENKEFGKAEGEEYMDFIVHRIKPYIDNNYRTLTDRENTAIMGSSMGGLISHYAIYKYPNIFGKAGIFSPSYWFSDEVFSYIKNNPVPNDTRLFLLVGQKEGDGMTVNTQKMYDQILSSKHPKENIKIIIDPKGNHNEAFWREQFTYTVHWLFRNK